MTTMRAGVGLLTLAIGVGCGYALVGRGVNVDPSIKRIGVPLFKDLTGRPGLDQKITEKVVEELLKRGHFDVVQTALGVDALVEGELTQYTVTPVGFSDRGGATATTEANRYAVLMTAKVRYTKVGQKEPIWSNDGFAFRDEYNVADTASGFFDQEGQALDRLASSFARSLVAAMLEAF